MARGQGVLLVVSCVALACGGLGCQSKTERAREKALTQASTFQTRLKAIPDQIDGTLRDLAQAVSGQNPNREADFRKFQGSLTQLRESARSVGNKYIQARADSDKFFIEWSKEARQLTGPERLALEDRIHQRITSRADAMDYFDKARTSFLKLSDSLGTIESNLAGKFSDENVHAQEPLVQKSMVDGNDAKIYAQRLDEVLSAVINSK